MDDIQQRLKDSSEACIKSYEKWAANKKDSAARESLQESIHELRKVTSRLEIEMAVSERDEMALRKIEIPPHRAAQRRPGQGMDEGEDDSRGNTVQGHAQQHTPPNRGQQQRPRSGGGGGGGSRMNK